MYRQEAERARFQKEAPTIDEFLAGLGLKIAISEPAPEQVDRVAQLTQRTNQFNFTHGPPQRRRDPPAGRVGPGMPGGGGERPVRRLRPGRRDDLRRPRRGPGGRHVPPELPGAGPGRRAPHAERAGGDRPGPRAVAGRRDDRSSPRRTSRPATSSRRWRRPTGGRSKGACGTRSRRRRPRASPIGRRRRPRPETRPWRRRRAAGRRAVRRRRRGRPQVATVRADRRRAGDPGAGPRGDPRPIGPPSGPARRQPAARAARAPRSKRRWPGSGPTCCGSSRWGSATTSSTWAGRRSWPSTCSPGSSGDSARRCR